jgi:hypothetical protein
MKFRVQRNIGPARQILAGLCVVCGLAACTGFPGLDPYAGADAGLPADPQRAAAIAEMRAMAEAGDEMPYPDAFQREQTARLAVRAEPLGVPEVQAIEAELALIAERRAATGDAGEIAALDARARELRRLALAAGHADLR